MPSARPIAEHLWPCRSISSAFERRFSTRAVVTPNCYRTADELVHIGSKVLLIRRGGAIRHGQWTLPGNFIDPGEMSYAASLRVLKEETSFPMTRSALNAEVTGKRVPRSQPPRKPGHHRLLLPHGRHIHGLA